MEIEHALGELQRCRSPMRLAGMYLSSRRRRKITAVEILFVAVIHRSFGLMSGFAALMRDRNFFAAAQVLRAQFHEVMRLAALRLVTSREVEADRLLLGVPLELLDSRTGTMLTEGRVADSLDAELEGVRDLYLSVVDYTEASDRLVEHDLRQQALRARVVLFDFAESIQGIPSHTFVEMITVYNRTMGVLLWLLLREMEEGKRGKPRRAAPAEGSASARKVRRGGSRRSGRGASRVTRDADDSTDR